MTEETHPAEPALAHRRTIWLLALLLLLSFTVALPVQATLGAPRDGSAITQPNYCESLNGRIIVRRGTATCFSDATSHAIASGTNSHADATNTSRAYATGYRSLAQAENQSKAIANGDKSSARAVDCATAIANGTRSSSTVVGTCRPPELTPTPPF